MTDKELFKLNRELSDFTWKNCDHEAGPHTRKLVCRKCAISWMLSKQKENRAP